MSIKELLIFNTDMIKTILEYKIKQISQMQLEFIWKEEFNNNWNL